LLLLRCLERHGGLEFLVGLSLELDFLMKLLDKVEFVVDGLVAYLEGLQDAAQGTNQKRKGDHAARHYDDAKYSLCR